MPNKTNKQLDDFYLLYMKLFEYCYFMTHLMTNDFLIAFCFPFFPAYFSDTENERQNDFHMIVNKNKYTFKKDVL